MNRALLFVIAFSLFLTGCSDHVSLSGRVTYSDDGSPLESGTVIFQTAALFARGEIGKDGKYVMATMRPNDGLPPGQYRVFVNSAYRYEFPEGGGPANEILLITHKYTSPETSELVVDVDRSTRTFDFQVDRMPGTKKIQETHKK